jgi:bifunctional DNA-binding transcriptional regulator/antitoxin component of YhaV-PrlF toxin-antitoxin module
MIGGDAPIIVTKEYNTLVLSHIREADMRERFTTIIEDRKIEIPSEMLACLGLKPGDAVDLCIRDGLLQVAGPVSIVERTAGALKPPPGMIPPSAEEMRQMAEEAIAEDAFKRMGGQ